MHGTTPCPQPSPGSPEAQDCPENPLELQTGEWSGLPHTPRPHCSITGHHQDARLALDLFANYDEETNSFPRTRETFPGEVQLLPEKSGKAKAGNSAALIFNNSLA